MPTAKRSCRSARPARNSAALPYSASASTCPNRAPDASTRSISSSAIRHFGRYATVSGTPAAARRPASAHQSSGRNSRRPTPTGTSALARVSETSDWQFARLPSWPQYWRLTPTEWRPCLASAVSSTTSTASGPPARQPVGGPHQLVLQGLRRPGRGGDEVVQLLEVARRHARGHRLAALPFARQQQALEVEGRPAPLLLAPEPRQERLEPTFQLVLPASRRWPVHRPLRREPSRGRNARPDRRWQRSVRAVPKTHS